MTELCTKCEKRPRRQRKGTTGVLCASCFLLALADFILEPVPGDTEDDKVEAKKVAEWLRRGIVIDETS